MDREIVDRVKTKLGLEAVEMLHPGPMYRCCVFLVREGQSRASEAAHRFKPLARVDRSPALKDLPRDYVAVRFYFRPSFPDTPENRQFAADTIRSISREIPVVLLNTGVEAGRSRRSERARYGHPPRRSSDDAEAQPRGADGDRQQRARSSAPTAGWRIWRRSTACRRSRSIQPRPSCCRRTWTSGGVSTRLMGVPASALDTRAADTLRSVLGSVVHMDRAVGS